MYIGWISACFTGLGMPSLVFLFGNIVDSFDSNTNDLDQMISGVKRMCWILCLIGGFIWIVTYVYYTCLLIFSERVTKKTKVEYVKAILKQDAEWFDLTNPSELSSRVSKECLAI
jgi:ABC-type multidrug transport system fused ATPase/permease subunit